MKTKNVFYFLVLTAIIAWGLTSCSKKNDPEQTYGAFFDGLGDSAGRPTGTQFVMPAGLKVVGTIKGGIPYDESAFALDKRDPSTLSTFIARTAANQSLFRATYYQYQDYGFGVFVYIIIDVENETGQDKTLVFPPGMVFINEDGTAQNGFLVQEVRIPVPHNDMAHAAIHCMCLNVGRHASSADNTYSLGPVSNNALLKQITDILKGKTLASGSVWTVQNAVWSVTEDKELTQETIDALKAL